MSHSDPGEITLLLSKIQDPETLETLMNLAYNELHGIAKSHFRKERPGHTWSPTVLLNEACIRLLQNIATFENRKHFFGAASQAMRRLLVEGARRRAAQKRGANWRRVDFNEAERIGFEQLGDLMDVEMALNRLEADQPKLGAVVKLHVFGGCSHAEAAAILGIRPATARKRWSDARKKLREALANYARTERNCATA